MQTATIFMFLVLIISAPWASRKWGNRGALAWGIAVLAFIAWVLFILE
jgi:hypothetical protein